MQMGIRCLPLVLIIASCIHTSVASAASSTLFMASSLEPPKLPNGQSVMEALHIEVAADPAACEVLLEQSVEGGVLMYRCGVNLVEGDHALLLINGHFAGANDHKSNTFHLPPDFMVTASSELTNMTVVFVDGETAEILSTGIVMTGPGADHALARARGQDNDEDDAPLFPSGAGRPKGMKGCTLRPTVPDYDMTVVVTTGKPRFYYLHFQRNDTGDADEYPADWRHPVSTEVKEFFEPLLANDRADCAAAIGSLLGRDMRVDLNDPKYVHMCKPVVIDVGANRGSHACLPAALGATVWAVEPFEFHARRLSYMSDINGWDMHVFCGGVSATTGEHIIHHTGSNIEMRDVSKEPGKEIVESWTVPVTRLDEWVTVNKDSDHKASSRNPSPSPTRRIALLKIDTDGHDLKAVQGAKHLFLPPGPGINYAKIEFIPYSLETMHPELKNPGLDMLLLLRSYGLALYNVALHHDYNIQEWFCYKDLEPILPGQEAMLMGEMMSRRTPDFPWIATTLLAVAQDKVKDMGRDLPCPPRRRY